MKVAVAVIATAMMFMNGCHYGVSDIAGVPDNPTYRRDIYPLYADHCLLCHSSPPDRGAPNTFRLDVYDDPSADVAGAKSTAGMALVQVQDGKMPPAAKHGDGVGPNGLQMLKNWLANDTPE